MAKDRNVNYFGLRKKRRILRENILVIQGKDTRNIENFNDKI